MLKNRAEAAEQDVAIAQKEKDLENFKRRVAEPAGNTRSPAIPTQKSNPNGAAPGQQHAVSKPLNTSGSQVKPTNKDMILPNEEQSDAKDDWEHQKKMDRAQSTTLDSLMSMIGLESVKEQFLGIKSKIDTLVRQGVPLSGERFGAALLGNPGTGKTTVARLYAEFLVEVGALP